MLRAVLVLALVAGAGGCGDDDDGTRDGTDGGAPDAGPTDASPPDGPVADATAELIADAGDNLYAWVGDEVVLDGSASLGALRYQWSFGDGRGWTEPRDEAVARVTYDTPGRYPAVLTAFDALGRRRSDTAVVTVTERAVHTPRQSSTVAALPGRSAVAAVSTDSDELVVYSWTADGSFTLEARIATARGPRTVTPWGEWLAVPCQEAAVVELIRRDDPAVRHAVPMPRGSRPFGAVGGAAALHVSLQATGELARIVPDGAGFRLDATVAAIADARGVALLPDGRIAVTRWRSPDERGEVAVVDPAGVRAREVWTLAYDPQMGSDTESGGVPTYLEQLLVSPTGSLAAVPSLQAAIGEGLYRSDRPLTFQTSVRAVVSWIDPAGGGEHFELRKQFDDRGLASAGVFTSRGDFLFLAMRGSRAVERLDVLTGAHSGSILNVGFAPDGLALSSDDRLLFALAPLSRELVVYDVTDLGAPPEPVARLPLVSAEPLDAEVLRGKQLFNDSFDTRISQDGYVACAHCHLDGLSDHRTWDFTDRGEGLRNTIALVGRAGAAHGPIHWSGNFDEVQDFEHDIRNAFAGTGLMDDADFHGGTRDQTLGDPKAGVSADLDALAAYVTSLADHLPSPHRNADGTLTAAAARGRVLFESATLGCTTCHAGEHLSDSRFESAGVPRLHDVGTLGAGSGQRLGGTLEGIDTPTLHGLWHSPPYLHDGSAPSLRDVLTTRNPDDRHGVTSGLAPAELDDLLAYLLSLDGQRD